MFFSPGFEANKLFLSITILNEIKMKKKNREQQSKNKFERTKNGEFTLVVIDQWFTPAEI
jgi:hypothetical protein